MMLEDGTVLPSFMQSSSMGVSGPDTVFSNISLVLGEVREIVRRKNPKSISKRWTEYTVEAQQAGGGAGGTNLYAGCTVSSLFGTSADHFTYTLRADKNRPKNGIGVGSKVLLLCLNGSKTKAQIVGAIRDTGNDVDGTGYEGQDAESGHTLNFEFNGIRATINDNGELEVTFRGATNSDGSLRSDADSNATGSKAAFLKDGSVKLTVGDQYVHLDKTNKKLAIQADTSWEVKVNGNLNFDVTSQILMKTKSGCTIEAGGLTKIESLGLHVGGAGESMLLGTSYRTAEGIMNAQLIAGLTALASSLTVVSASLALAGPLMLIPVVGAMTASVPILTAAGAVAGAVTAVSTMLSAITAFESQSATFLSLKNRLD